jgi:hypothetical protein
MRRSDLIVVVVLFLLAAMPAHAYADPSGGTLFQILMPMLAALWAMWMIFANRVRNAVTALYRRLRGVQAEETAD